MVKSLLSTSLFFLTICASAQIDFVLTLQGDSIAGKVTLNSTSVVDRVQINTGTGKVNLTAMQVKEVNINKEVFEPVQLGERIRFMKLIKSGFMSLYAYKVEREPDYAGRLLRKLDGSYVDVPTLTFRGALVNFLKECYDVSEKVKSKELGRNELPLIVDMFNDCMKDKTESRFNAGKAEISRDNKRLFIMDFIRKIEASSIDNKSEVTQILNDMLSKIESNQVVPRYQIEALKEYLKGEKDWQDQLDQLLSML
ncbi:MAG: hypothetical protein AB7O48_14405 [Cyclobacteriaceae bacterium]